MDEINVPKIGDINTKTNRRKLVVFKFFMMTLLYTVKKQKLCFHSAYVWLPLAGLFQNQEVELDFDLADLTNLKSAFSLV